MTTATWGKEANTPAFDALIGPEHPTLTRTGAGH